VSKTHRVGEDFEGSPTRWVFDTGE